MRKPDPKVSHFELSILVPIRIVDDHGQAPRSMQEVVDSLRVRGWGYATETEPGSERSRRIEHQAFSYFHPFVRRFMFDQLRVIRLARTDVECLRVTPSNWRRRAEHRLTVQSCQLWLFQRTEIGVLKLELRKPEGPGNWKLSRLQRLLDQIRRLYPPYFDGRNPGQATGGHCPQKVVIQFKDSHLKADVASDYGDVDRYSAEHESWAALSEVHEELESFAWATHWQALLEPFVTTPLMPQSAGHRFSAPKTWRAMQLGDDRAATMSFVAFASEDEFRQVTDGDWVRLCFADPPGSDRFPYQEDFLKGNAGRAPFQTRFCYDRFFYPRRESTDAPSRILNCGYSFTYAGSAADRYFFMNYDNGAIVSFRHIYVAMGVIAQFQRAALLASSFRISCLVKRDVNSIIDAGETEQAYDAFIWFTQWYWFDEISPQEQGQDLFAMFRRELRLQELFAEVRQELRDIVDLQNAKEQIKQAKAAIELSKASTELTRVAVPFAVLSICISILSLGASWLGMNVLTDDIKKMSLSVGWAIVIANLILFFGLATVPAALYLGWQRKADIWAAIRPSDKR